MRARHPDTVITALNRAPDLPWKVLKVSLKLEEELIKSGRTDALGSKRNVIDFLEYIHAQVAFHLQILSAENFLWV